MAQFSKGATVLRYDSSAKGVIMEVHPPRRGRQIYSVNWNGVIRDELEEDLILDYDISDPFERCSNGFFGTYSEYSKKNTAFKIQSSNNSTISSLKASKTLFRAYQFKPLLKFLNSPNRRLLVADEVGLGKTIEAGHIMLELKARRELQNVLIVCPKSLQVKWKAELQEKFGLTFRIFDDTPELIDELEHHNGRVRAIINYEKIRLKKESTQKESKEQKVDSLIEYLTESGRKFSLVVCDEAHRMRNDETQTYRGAEILMSMADSALFLTATPVMISTENLYNLLHLLNNAKYFNYQIFNNLLSQNRPFIEAITALNHNAPLPEILSSLVDSEVATSYSADDREIYSRTTTVGESFQNNPVFREIIERLRGEDTHKNRARIQYLLSTISVMNSEFSRTRKREVTMDMSQAERKPHIVRVGLNSFERQEFDRVIDEYIDENSYIDNDTGEQVLYRDAVLGLIQKKRRIASSVFGYLNTDESLDEGVDLYAKYEDGKVNNLIRIIEEVFQHGPKKLVIFAIFRKTLKYLQIRLKKKGYGSLIIHGLIDGRAEILQEFKTNPNAHILLSSEVGSEGLDMQFCNSMVNYDLPWNPMVVEQRIGRIDRFGQQAEVVNIYNMVVADSIQEEIYDRLLNRIGIFQGTIGDMEAILEAPIRPGSKLSISQVFSRYEKEFYTNKLTPEERRRKMEEVERAIENEKENIRHLDEGLNNTLTNDSYFREEITRILGKNAFVTDIELRNFIESAISRELTTCSLEPLGGEIYQFVIPVSTPRALKNFMIKYQPPGDEYDTLFNSFIRSIDGISSFRLTFNQQLSYEDRTLIYVNMYHPLICACLTYFVNNDDKVKTSFSYALNADAVLKRGSVYYLAVYKLKTSRLVQGVRKTSAELYPIIYDTQKSSVVQDQDLVDHLFGESQIAGIERNPGKDYQDSDLIQDMRYDFLDQIRIEKNNRLSEIQKISESERQSRDMQTREYYQSLIANREHFIEAWEWRLENISLSDKERRNLESAIRINRANVETLKKAFEAHLEAINLDPEISIEEELLSLNLISII